MNQSKYKKFLGVCRKCNQPMKLIEDTNVVVCSNEKCENKHVRLLTEHQVEIIKNIMEE